MLCICQCESSNDSNAVNYNGGNNPPTWDTGLCQINDVNWDTNLNPNAVCAGIVNSQGDLCNPNTNAQCAYAIFQESGFQPWSADARCGCNVMNKDEWEGYKEAWELN